MTFLDPSHERRQHKCLQSLHLDDPSTKLSVYIKISDPYDEEHWHEWVQIIALRYLGHSCC